MSINSSFFMSQFNFDVTVKSLLLGYTRKENVNVTDCVNVVVFGTTEASAQAFVANSLKGTVPDNIRCAGVDTKPSIHRGKGFTGYIVMLPELQYIGARHFDRITEVVEILNLANHGTDKTGDYKDLEILFANRDIEGAFFGSTFEKWKTEMEQSHNWHIYDEHPQYSRAYRDRPTSLNPVYLGEDEIEEVCLDEVEDDAPSIPKKGRALDKRLHAAAPYVLSWTKVATLLLQHGCELSVVDPTDIHPVRFGPQFCALSTGQIYEAISKFTMNGPFPTTGHRRIACVHDAVARAIFKERMQPDLAIGAQYGVCAGSSHAHPSIDITVKLSELIVD